MVRYLQEVSVAGRLRDECFLIFLYISCKQCGSAAVFNIEHKRIIIARPRERLPISGWGEHAHVDAAKIKVIAEVVMHYNHMLGFCFSDQSDVGSRRWVRPHPEFARMKIGDHRMQPT